MGSLRMGCLKGESFKHICKVSKKAWEREKEGMPNLYLYKKLYYIH